MITAFRIATLLVGSFAFGLTLLVTALYVSVWRKLRTNGLVPVYHVPVIGLAHMLLVGASMGAIASRIVTHGHFVYWMTPLCLAAYSLTLGVLVQLLRSPRVRHLDAQVQAHGRM